MSFGGIFMGASLTYLTVKTESIWPAAIMHGVNNAMPSFLVFYINAYNEKLLLVKKLTRIVFS